MSLGALGKTLAGQALEATKKNVIDSIVGPEPAKAAPAAAVQDSVGSVIAGQIQAMQRPLRDDQELLVMWQSLRVTEIFVPTPQVLVLIGMDAQQNLTRVVAAAESLQLVCKVLRVAEGVKAVRVTVTSPRREQGAVG
jgi:hypothetical protein